MLQGKLLNLYNMKKDTSLKPYAQKFQRLFLSDKSECLLGLASIFIIHVVSCKP